MLDERLVASVDELAKSVKKERAVISHTLQLTLLFHEIIHMTLTATLPADITLKNFKAGLPADCEAQKKFLGI